MGSMIGKRKRVLLLTCALLLLTAVNPLLRSPLTFPGSEEARASLSLSREGDRVLSAAKLQLIRRLDRIHYPAGSYRPGEAVVELADPDLASVSRFLGEFSSLLREDVPRLLEALAAQPVRRALRLPLRPGLDVLMACRKFLASPLVKRAEPNLFFRLAATEPNDFRYPLQWNLWSGYGINADLAWDLQKGSSSLVLAVVDTGVYINHEDLAGRVLANGYDYINRDPDPSDDNGHGTLVAGIACANTDNLRGIAGVDWRAKIMPLKALNSRGEGSLDSVVNSIYHAVNHGARVINLSLTSSVYSQILAEAVEYAHAQGCTLVAAAGNEGTDRLNYPAGLTYVIGVGSVGRDGKRSYFSNYNSSVDLVAPGEEIWGTDLNNSYSLGNGTSEAAPQVSAAALLLSAEYPGASPDEVWRRLRDGALDLGSPGYDEEYGWGLLDIYTALRVPLVRINSPSDYSYPVSEKVSAEAHSENLDISHLELWVDGELLETHVLPTPSRTVTHTFTSWNTGGLEEGTHEITVRAVGSGVVVSGEQTVTVFRNTSQPRPSTEWYLAEGCTAYGFEEYVLVQNPNPAPASVRVDFMVLDGPAATRSFTMAPRSRLTIGVNSLVPDSEVSAHVHADLPVVVERAMYWAGRTDGHVSPGSSHLSNDWYLAEGCTAYGFEEYVLVQNPNPASASVRVDFMVLDGPAATRSFTMAPRSRLTIGVNSLVPDSEVSAHVHADLPVVVERAMYWGGRDGGHGALGVSSPSVSWYLAEGCTAWGFEEYVLVQNPGTEPANLSVAFLKPDGTRTRRVFVLAARSRLTLDMRQFVPGSDVSTAVRSDQPVVVERAMYWPSGSRYRAGGHCSAGTVTAAGNWYLAEGCTAYGFQEYVLLANVSREVAHVNLAFMRPDGTTRDFSFSVAAGARYTVAVNAVEPAKELSVRVTSDFPLVVERSMYWTDNDGGTNVVGALQP